MDTAVCEGGQWVGCPESKGDDVCETGNDNNCNGIPNEGCSCVDGTVQPCGHPEVGVCKMGTSTCGNSQWGSCLGSIDPGPRDCSSADDNDCDGSPDDTVDEACKCEVGTTRPCDEHPGLDGNGPCQAGSQTCTLSADGATSDWSECTGSVGPRSADTCDAGNDDNCNGTPNEGCPCVNGDTQSCGHAAVGICKPGVSTCSNSQWGECVGNVEPKLRDCSSSLDNDCDGKADNTTDSVCQCPVGDTQACGTHPGKDGLQRDAQRGVLVRQWDADELPVRRLGCWDCRSRRRQRPGSATLGFGHKLAWCQVCPADLGWVSNKNDCDDNNPNMYAGVNLCLSDQVTRQSCPSSGGVLNTQTCMDGCLNGACRSDGTIGVPGVVSCNNTTRCSSTEGCDYNLSYCGGSNNYTWYCDAASDCPSGQKCWHFSFSGINETRCSATRPQSSYREVCDPLNPTCTCEEFIQSAGGARIYRCPLG